MKLTGYRGYSWENDNWWHGIPAGFQLSVSLQPAVLARAGTTPTLGVGSFTERVIPGSFGYRGAGSFETARNALLQKLNVLDPTPGTLTAVMNDGTTATVQALMTLPPGGNATGNLEVNTVPVNFVIVDPVFVAATPTTVSTSVVGATQDSLTVAAIGFGENDATVTIKQTAQRSTFTEAAGWTYRRKYTLTNTGTAKLENYPVGIDLGSTTALVSGSKALSSGNDLRVVYGGAEVPRTLAGWNSGSTLVWIVIDALAAGASRTYEVWYGNSGAGTPTTLTGSLLPAFDTATSTNTVWKYLVDRTAANAGKGGWTLSSGTATPKTPADDQPGQWKTTTTFENTDDHWQAYYSTYTATGTKYQGRFDAKRLYQKSNDFDKRQYANADGVLLQHPLGITKVRCDIDHEVQAITTNQATTAVGQVVLLSRATAGGAWQTVTSVTAVGAAGQVAAADYTVSPTAEAVAFAVWPPTALGTIDRRTKVGRYVYGGWYSVLEVTVSGALLTQTLAQAEEAIMDVAATVYVGGGSTHVAPYTVLRIGGAATRRYATRIDEQLVVDGAARRVRLYDSTGATLVENVPDAAVDAKQKKVGDTAERAADRWAPLDPTQSTVLWVTLTNGGTATVTAAYRTTYL